MEVTIIIFVRCVVQPLISSKPNGTDHGNPEAAPFACLQLYLRLKGAPGVHFEEEKQKVLTTICKLQCSLMFVPYEVFFYHLLQVHMKYYRCMY